MSTFSSILSSINGKSQATPHSSDSQRLATAARDSARPNTLTTGNRLSSSNVIAGVKRKSEEPEDDSRAKAAKTVTDGVSRPATAASPPSRFQLSAKSGVSQKPSQVPHRPSPNLGAMSNPQKTVAKPTPKSTNGSDANTTSSATSGKRGFASIMEKAKAAQEAAKATGPSGIKHKAVEKMTKRERRKMMEEAKAQQKSGKGSQLLEKQQSRPGGGASSLQKEHVTSYKGTMARAAVPLSYKGTMQTAASSDKRDKTRKGQPQDKYGGYVSWSDLDDAEEQEDYDSDGSSDMEGGFDEVEREEVSAMQAARKEDQMYLEEEERHRREKLERKRKLQELSKSAASRKRY